MRGIPILAVIFVALGAGKTFAQDPPSVDSLEARVWLDRGDEPVVRRGDDVRIYYRTSHDASVAIFKIDTDGLISMLYPQHPGVVELVRGGRDYRLLFPRSPRWRVEEDPGVGYFFMVASPEPLDFSAFDYNEEDGWDLGVVGSTVYEDPYVAIDEYVATILPDWEVVPYALDFVTYHVERVHEYPRFLCYDCHGYRSYATWNPYLAYCSSYRVVIWDDPYFYPRYRYLGTRVVFARPLGPRPRYGVARRVVGAPSAPIVRTRAAPVRRAVEYKETPRRPTAQPRNPSPQGSTGPTTSRPARLSALLDGNRPSTTSRRGVVLERPFTNGSSTTRPGATARRGATATPAPSGSRDTGRPTLQRRPPTPSARLPGSRSLPRASPPGAERRGSVGRGVTPGRSPATTRGTTPTRVVRPPDSRAGATSRRAPARVAPGGGASARSPATGRPSTGSRPRATGGPVARSAPRPPARARPTPPRRPGGRGRGG